VALDPHSEKPDTGATEDYSAHHPEDHPSDWGWHGEWGPGARRTGWLVFVVLLIMLTATHYNHSGSFWLIFFAAGILVIQLWDIQRRKNAWRK
jgi:hypothetical protein